MSLRALLAIVGSLFILVAGPYSCHRYIYPYGWSHSCDIQLKSALNSYAHDHDGRYPAGEATPEASLSLLYPRYANAYVLSGKTVPPNRAEEILARGELLGPESCDWHYVEGLTLADDPRIAIFWDKIGLNHFGGRLPEGGHSIYRVGATQEVIPEKDWPQFLAEQEELLAARDDHALKGEPALAAKIRLPSGEIVDHFQGEWKLEINSNSLTGGSSETTSGSALAPSSLRWYRLHEGTSRYTLTFVNKGLRSKLVTIHVSKGKATPNSVIFEMESR
jgi:hypothetical protein